MIDEAIDKTVTQAADKISEAIAKYGPQAADFALSVGRIGAAQQIITGLSLLLVSYLVYRFWAYPMSAPIREGRKKPDFDLICDIDPVTGFGSGIGWCAVIGFGIAAVVNLSDVFAWAGLFEPQIYLAAKLLKLN